MKIHNALPAFAAVIALAATATGCSPKVTTPELTPLEIQSLQTREFEAKKKIVFASVISVFQDLGYTINTTEAESGMINAVSTTQDLTTSGARFAAAFFGGRADEKNAKTQATAFVEQIGGITRVRLNFVNHTSSSSAWGQDKESSHPILDAQVYQNAFERIENAIFVRSP